MVAGMDTFQEYFRAYTDQYVLIGGTAASIAMDEAGLEFRATKDLDIVLVVEALTAEFGQCFWEFVQAGGYEIRESSQTGKPIFYRFQKPADPRYPHMLELFSRTPEGLILGVGSHLTPIPVDEAVSSLSAILLDDEYYAFIIAGRRREEGLAFVGEDRLIPLKARAWLDMTARRKEGEDVDSRNIRKHANDVLRLSQLLGATSSIPVSERIATDMKVFLAAITADATIDPRALGIQVTVADISERLSRAYQLN